MRKLSIVVALLAATQASPGWSQAAPEPPRILVDGYGEVQTMPDRAVINYSVRGEGATSDGAVRAMTATAARIEASLHHIDATARPTTGGVRVSPVKSSACKDRDYESDDEQLSKGACAIVGYVATQSVELRTADVKNAGTMVGLAGRGGAISALLARWDLDDPRDAKRRAIAAALVDAQGKANAIAAGTHVGLGPILTIATTNRDAVRTEDLINSLPQSFGAMAERDEPVPIKLTPEPITTSATVTVSYAIAR